MKMWSSIENNNRFSTALIAENALNRSNCQFHYIHMRTLLYGLASNIGIYGAYIKASYNIYINEYIYQVVIQNDNFRLDQLKKLNVT